METNFIFPDDLVEDILSRLPIKDLLRVRSVSKRWRALIDNVSFIKKHYQVQYSFRSLDDNMPYFIDHLDKAATRGDEFYLLSIQQGNNAVIVDVTADLRCDSNAVLPYGADQYCIKCRGCVNGIICLTCESGTTNRASDSFVAVWNPATREFKTLAYPNDLRLTHINQLQIDGFGFDQSSNDFKILGVYSIFRGVTIERSFYRVIYSLKSNSWKWIGGPPAYIDGLPLAYSDRYLNGVCYWVTEPYKKSGRSVDIVIVSFDYTTEVFKVSDLPNEAISLVLKSAPYHMTIALYKECLALAMSFKVQDEASYEIHIWVATRFDDFGAPLSWEHLFTIGPTPAKFGLSVDIMLMNGDLKLTFEHGDGNLDSEDYLYDHSMGEFKKFDIWWNAWFRYVESLFPLSTSANLGHCVAFRAELRAIHRGLQLAKDLYITRLVVQVDNLACMQALRSSKTTTGEYANLIQACRKLISLQEWEVKIMHVYREANAAADWLANQGVNQEEYIKIYHECPLELKRIIELDERGVAWPRMIAT